MIRNMHALKLESDFQAILLQMDDSYMTGCGAPNGNEETQWANEYGYDY